MVSGLWKCCTYTQWNFIQLQRTVKSVGKWVEQKNYTEQDDQDPERKTSYMFSLVCGY